MISLKQTILSVSTIFILAGCTSKSPYTNRSQMIFVSSSEEMALGEKSYKEALSEAKVITNTKDAKRVKTIGQKIAQVSQKNDFNWEFNLVEDEQANAFFFPGEKLLYTQEF